jgi:hypothetical protein
MVPKPEMPENISLRAQGQNYKVNIYELKDHVGENGLSLNWLTKLGLAKKTPFASFHSCLLKNT